MPTSPTTEFERRPPVGSASRQAKLPELPEACYAAWSVDDAVAIATSAPLVTPPLEGAVDRA